VSAEGRNSAHFGSGTRERSGRNRHRFRSESRESLYRCAKGHRLGWNTAALADPFLLFAFWIAAASAGGAATDSAVLVLGRAPAPDNAAPLVCWSETRSGPRPLHVHFLRVDLRSPEYEPCALIADDPDGAGPAEAALRDPLALAARPGVVAAVNANAFQSLPDSEGKRNTEWFAEKPVDIVGLAASGGIVRSRPDSGRSAFWAAADGKAHIGIPPETDGIREGVSDWSGTLLRGGVDVAPGTNVLHPRTMVGIDASERWLTVVVVDGRRPGYSEGVSLHEGAIILKEQGCAEAIALDGGGSSLLVISDLEGKGVRVVNRPSGERPRPIPVMLGVRRRRK
jgi:hypothetical protein